MGDQIIKNVYNSSHLIKYLPQDSFRPNHLTVSKIITQFSDKQNAELIKGNKFIEPILGKKCNELSGGEKRLLEHRTKHG